MYWPLMRWSEDVLKSELLWEACSLVRKSTLYLLRSSIFYHVYEPGKKDGANAREKGGFHSKFDWVVLDITIIDRALFAGEG